jgi:hypothetical protein
VYTSVVLWYDEYRKQEPGTGAQAMAISPRISATNNVNDADVYLARVSVTRIPARDDMPTYWTVSPIWAGVDRMDTGGTGCKTLKLAHRLRQAIEAGVALGPAEVRTDVNGRTYVQATHNFLAKRLNADLKRLGF